MLIDGILVAFCRRDSASMIALKRSIKDNILRVYNNLSIRTSHFISKINFLLEINLPLYFIILNSIINDMIFYIILLEIKRKTTIFTCIFCLYFDITSFGYRACIYIRWVFFLCFDLDWYILISFFKIRCNLRQDIKLQCLVWLTSKENMIE
jgi:hypothetical protein